MFVQVRSAYLRCLENYLTTSFFGATRAARPGAEAGDLGIFTGAVMSTVASAAYEPSSLMWTPLYCWAKKMFPN